MTHLNGIQLASERTSQHPEWREPCPKTVWTCTSRVSDASIRCFSRSDRPTTLGWANFCRPHNQSGVSLSKPKINGLCYQYITKCKNITYSNSSSNKLSTNICVLKVWKYLEEDFADVTHILNSLVEPVELEQSQVCLQIVSNLFGLNIDVPKEEKRPKSLGHFLVKF